MTHTITLSSGRTFQSEKNISLLDAAESSGTVLPYSCRIGRCSSCKAWVVAGQTEAIFAEEGLEPGERDAGYVLTCVRKAVSDLRLEIADLTGLALPPVSRFPCRIDRIEMLTPSVMRLVLRTPPKSPFTFLPGQYVDLTRPDGLKRSYSVAEVDTEGKLHLLIKRVVGGAMSEFLFDTVQSNALMNFSGPLGTFCLRETENRDLVFLATGTGIAPVLAMLGALKDGQPPASVRVYWGGRLPDDLFLDVTALYPYADFVPVLSRAAPMSGYRSGYVQDVFLQEAGNLSVTDVYACGSDAMIRSAQHKLQAAGLPRTQFFSDAFVSSS